eukprot:scaffold3871_cov97-Isochrysis_galbana.AAC.2
MAAPACGGWQVLADGGTEKFKFPPIDNSKKGRCTFTSSAMGQANAARDSLYDLRECKMAGSDASTFDMCDCPPASFSQAFKSRLFAIASFFQAFLSPARLPSPSPSAARGHSRSLRCTLQPCHPLGRRSGALMEKGDFSNSNFRETQLSKARAACAICPRHRQFSVHCRHLRTPVPLAPQWGASAAAPRVAQAPLVPRVARPFPFASAVRPPFLFLFGLCTAPRQA